MNGIVLTYNKELVLPTFKKKSTIQKEWDKQLKRKHGKMDNLQNKTNG